MTTPIDDKLNEYNISGMQTIIPIDFDAGSVEFVSVKVGIKFLNQIPIDIAFTNQHTLDNFPDNIEFNTITRDSTNSFEINAREFRLPILILRTTNPDHTTNILLKYDVFPATENFVKTTATTNTDSTSQKKWNDYIYIVIAVFVILFIIIFVLKLTKK